MLRSNWFRVLLIIIFAAAIGYYDLPDGYQKLPGTPEAVKDARIHLGLDLQGGSQLDYKIDLRKVPNEDRKAIVEGVKEVINRRVNSLGVSEPNIYTSTVGDEEHLVVELAGIKDLDEAKQVVGKTIQLEFKERREKQDPNYKAAVRSQANGVFQNIRSGKTTFLIAGQEESQAAPEKVKFEELDWKFSSEIEDKKIAAEIEKTPAGNLVPKMLEGNSGYTLLNGEVTPLEGFFIIRVEDKRSTANLPEDEKALQVSHLLVAYKGSERAAETITRTKDEARARAEELLTQMKAEGNFAELTKANSDEPNAKDSAGKLSVAVRDGGDYDEKFTAAALKLTSVNELSPVTETPFGFHIIRADNFSQIKYSQIFFSGAPDPWQETELTGEHFEHADVTFDDFLRPIVSIRFNDEGAKLFENLTEKNIDKPIAIFVGGNLISSPNVNEKISGGSAVITGQFTVEEAQALARDLNTGAIPAPVVLSGQYTIGATLGQTALDKSLRAGMIGLIVLSIFMILYYRLPGLISVLALGVYSATLLFLLKSGLPLPVSLTIAIAIFIALLYKILRSREGGWEKTITFILACFVLFFVSFLLSNPVILTLAGVAGVILSIGMAVDANILIFERMKEELRAGRPLSSAIEIGFDRAWSSIRDSNFSSLITCAILFYFGSSIIRGFAFNLAAGILVSMFSAITITRTLLMTAMKTRLGNKPTWWGMGFGEFFAHKTFRIVENRKIWFWISGSIIGISLLALFTIGLKLGLDFKGGTLLDLTFEKSVTVEEISAELGNIESSLNEKNGAAQASSAETGDTLESAEEKITLTNGRIVPAGEKQFLLNLEHMNNETHEAILTAFEKRFGAVTENRFTTLGPVVGATLKQKAVLAILVAMAIIVLYIAFAFRKIPKRVSPWKFGLCAIVALFHDVIVPVGVFAVMQFEVDALFITAILTVLGFSVHDTIVVFDRIRENLKYQDRDESFAHVADKSLSQTMNRSINTSLTTLITLVMLLVFGSPSIALFTLVLVIGIVVGTYSSIFIAAPLLVMWQEEEK